MAKKTVVKQRPVLTKIEDIHIPKQDFPKTPGHFPPHSEAFEALKKSLRKKGMIVPVFVDKDKRLLQGHFRLWAWQEIGNKHVQAVTVDKPEDIIHHFL